MQGLYGVVHHNSKLLVPVLMLLVKQLDIYVDPDEDAEPPMRLEPTIVTQGEKVDIVEPLVSMQCNPTSVCDVAMATKLTHSLIFK